MSVQGPAWWALRGSKEIMKLVLLLHLWQKIDIAFNYSITENKMNVISGDHLILSSNTRWARLFQCNF